MEEYSHVHDENLSKQYQNLYERDENDNSNEIKCMSAIEISKEQKIQQEKFLKQFTEFSPSKNIKFLTQDYELRLIQNIQLYSNLSQDIYNFYKDQHQNSEKIKSKVITRLNNLHYSMNNLSLISKFFKSYSSYQNFCDSAQMILGNRTCENPPYEIFEHAILWNILQSHRYLFLNNILVTFKNFPLIRRREILNIAVNRYFTSIKKETESIPLEDNSKERIISELSRLSHNLGINFDVEMHDGQHFIYECETLLSEYQRLHFSFNLIKDIDNNPLKLIDCINNKFMETFSKDELIIEAFENIISPNKRYKIVVFNAINNKNFSSEQIQALINLRFCRNRQLLFELENLTKKICKYRNLIYENLQIKPTETEELFCNKYISYIIEQILIFTSAIYVKSDKKGDIDPLIENSLDQQLRYTKSKIKILSVFTEISKHSDSTKIKEFSDQIINKKPNLIFKGSSFYELFEVQIETLEMIGKTLSIILNLQILTERQIASFYGSFYEPFHFGTFYSNESEGDYNTSKFDVYLSIEKIIDFYSISMKIVEDICATMSIKSIEYSYYIELAIWSQLMNEITQNPEVSLFGTDFSMVHFNLAISKDVESLMNCRILDDPSFLKNFLKQIDDISLKSKFTQNLANFCFLATKLRSLIYKTNLYLPLYMRQYNEAHFSIGLTKTIEFVDNKSFNFTDYSKIKELCLNGNFSELIEMIKFQRRFNILLKIALQYNNYRSDNYYISFLFSIPRKDNVFYMTKSETKKGKKAKFYQDAAKEFFNDVDSIINQDFSEIFFDISEISDFSNPQKLFNQTKKYLNQIELASITNFERILLSDFQQTDFFSFDGQLFDPKNGFVDYFTIPDYSQCLSLDCDSFKFNQILTMASIRLKLISFLRLNSFLKISNKRSFDLLQKHQMVIESSFFSTLHSSPKKSIEEVIEIFQSQISMESGQFELSILLLSQKVFLTKKACHLQGKGKPSNLSLIPDEEIKNFWKLIHKEYLKDDKYSNKASFNTISIERYIPVYLSNFNFTISDIMKVELLERINEIKSKVTQNVIFSDSPKYQAESSDFIMKEYVNELLKFALLRLQKKVLFTDLNIVSIVDITRREYKETLPFYSNYVGGFAIQKVPSDASNGTENAMLKFSIHFSSEMIIKMVEEMQKKQNYEQLNEFTEKLEIFSSLDSPLKPECYMKKKHQISQKKEPYNPNPIDAQRQFENEMRYAKSKIVSNLIISLKSNSNNKNQMIFNFDSKNKEIFINLKFDSFISKLIQISNLLNFLLEKSRIQILKTWPSYTEQMKNLSFKYDEQDSLLNGFVKSLKERFNMELNYQISRKNSLDIMKLNNLRYDEKTRNHERSVYEEQITKEIRNEYEQKLSEIKKEKQEILKQFSIVHNKYFNEFDKVIQKQNEKVPLNEELLRPNHEVAQASLQNNEIKKDDKIQLKILLQKDDIEDKELEEKKKTQPIAFNFSSPKVVRPMNTVHSPLRPNSVKKLTENSPCNFNPQSPRSKMGSQRSFRGRNQKMVKSKEKVSLSENVNDTSTFSQEIHTSQEIHKKSNELSNPDILNKFVSDEKIKNAETEITDLRKTIIKLRIIKCLFKIGSSNRFNKLMNQMSYERKEASTLLWLNKKSFEEDTRDIKDDISECFNRLSNCEKESEILKQEIDEQKQITTKLAHWKELSLRSSDRILKQIGVYQKGPNVEVSKLLKKLEEKRDELDSLNKEAEEFENQLVNKVRQPMEEMSRIRKNVQNQQYQNLRMRENLNKDNVIIATKIQNLEEENNKLRLTNEKLKMQIKKFEDQKAQIPAIKIEATKELFELNQPTARRLKTSFINQRRGKAALTAKSPYAKIGYRSIKKPL